MHEEFELQMQSIKSVDAARAYVFSNNRGASSSVIADAADVFVRSPFVHGYSFFNPR